MSLRLMHLFSLFNVATSKFLILKWSIIIFLLDVIDLESVGLCILT